jgi:glycosyltransferase involved in cell wall biosynthesis
LDHILEGGVSNSTYAIVAHHYWNRPGGGELVCASAAKAFELAGFRPVLVSPVRIHVERYPEWFGIDLSSYPKIDLGIELRAFGLYLRLLNGVAIRAALRRFREGLVFTDNPTYRGVVKGAVKIVEYIHFPFETLFKLGFTGSSYLEDPYFAQRYSKFPMNMYFRAYLELLKRFSRENPFDVAGLVLANSRWTAELAGRIYGEEPEVLNPPIPPNVEVVKEPKPFEVRGDVVVMVGRFSEEKRYHWVVQEVLPRLRRVCGAVRLYIFGSTGTRTSRAYRSRLAEAAKSAGFKVSAEPGTEADVYLVENAPRKVINEVMDRAKVFLHATINEHWGIAVAEAMARGLPVVVHRSGGTWSDLAGEGSYGIGYNTAEEATEAVAKLLTDRGGWSYYSKKSTERALGLTLDRFTGRFTELLKKVGGG